MEAIAQIGGGRTPLPGKSQKMPSIPNELANCVFVDRTLKTAFCIKDSEAKLIRAFRNYVSLLKQGGFVRHQKYISAESFASLKSKMAESEEHTNSDMQNVAMRLFETAAKRKASDIHIITHENYGEVFFRINRDILPIKQFTREFTDLLLRAVYTSMTDLAEPTYKESQPQSARIKNTQFLPKNVHSIRLERTPVVDGEMMVFRFLYKSGVIPIEELGYSESLGQMDALRLMQKRPYGLIIIAGPTGSGKSTSLKNILTGMKARMESRNFITVEDPPEYPMDQINQIPIIVDAKATDEERKQQTSRALNSILRLDPDVIMIGEIRSKVWAELGLMAARTGHLTFASIHAESPFGIIARLVEILDTPNALSRIADIGILSGLIFQGLVQTLCPHCKKPLIGNDEQLPAGVRARLLQNINLAENDRVSIKGPGCDKCYHTGIAGQTLLAEVVVPDYYFIEKILTEGVSATRRIWLEQNPGQSIKHHALEKIKMGLVDPMTAESVVGPLTFDEKLKDRVLDRSEIHELSA